MKTMKKIVAILAVALLLCSMLPLSVMAADTTVVFELGANGSASHNDGTSKTTHSETVDGYTLSITGGTNFYTGARDAKGNSCFKLGTSSKAGSFTISNIPADVTSVVIAVAAYKAKSATMDVNGTKTTLTAKSDNGQYNEITVDTTSTKSISVKVSSGYRAMVNSITYVIAAPASAECDHDSLVCGDTCPECETFVKPHAYASDCIADCENEGCDEPNPDYNGVGHAYTSDYDASCNNCLAVRTDSLLPAEGEALSLEQAIAIGAGQDYSTYTDQKYYVTGIITEVYNTTYGNLYITDDENTFTVYGLYSIDGKIRYDAMEYKPNVSDEITVYGAIGNYKGTPQMQNGWLDEVVINCTHEFDNGCDTDCNLGCGYTRDPQHSYDETIVESTCTTVGTATYVCSVCQHSYSEELDLADHDYVNGKCSVCGAEKPAGYAPITSAEQFVSGEYILVVSSGYAPTYFDADAKWVLPGQPVIADGIISADDAADFLWTLTVDGNSVTITDANGVTIAPKAGNNNGIQSGDYAWNWTFADGKFIFAGVGSDTTYLASNTDATNGKNRFRAYKTTTVNGNTKTYLHQFTLYAASTSKPACAHEYDNACDVDCNLCYETREVSHSVQHVEAKAATCAANGNIEYWYCDVCGMAWLDEACAQNTNLKAVVLPATGEHTYFDACSAICEVCGYEREVSHNVVHVEAKAATCAANGNIEYWYCDVCGMAWLNAECTMNTNLRAVITPATGEHTYDDEYDADCNVCGDIREVPEKPVEIVYGDADGDGEITLRDVALVQQAASGSEIDADLIVIDVDCDSEITLRDVALVQQAASGWDVTLGPAEENKVFNDGELTIW